MSSLAMVILTLLTLSPGHYSRHLERHALPPQHRAQQIADYATHASLVTGVPRPLLVALWFHESTLNPESENKTSKAYGLGQLLPGTRWYNDWTKDCASDPYVCELKGAEHSARAVRFYAQTCGTLARGLTAYRSGRCMAPGPRALATIRLAQQISYRLSHPSTKPLMAARMP